MWVYFVFIPLGFIGGMRALFNGDWGVWWDLHRRNDTRVLDSFIYLYMGFILFLLLLRAELLVTSKVPCFSEPFSFLSLSSQKRSSTIRRSSTCRYRSVHKNDLNSGISIITYETRTHVSSTPYIDICHNGYAALTQPSHP